MTASTMPDHRLGEEGPLEAGDTYALLRERIARQALVGDLPTPDQREQLYAADDGIRARALRAIARYNAAR